MSKIKEVHNDLNKIRKGFKINHILLKNTKNEVIWKSEFDLTVKLNKEELPGEILECKNVTREINFSSEEEIDSLELVQDFYYNDELIDSSRFSFGFVMPNSNNCWEQTIEVNPNTNLLMVHDGVRGGNLVAESIFFSKTNIISKNKTILYYV
jgi:retinal rod rhodopsin-sensitive cGMP 3',5'-cyclic phosphodiesterase subunit delta